MPGKDVSCGHVDAEGYEKDSREPDILDRLKGKKGYAARAAGDLTPGSVALAVATGTGWADGRWLD